MSIDSNSGIISFNYSNGQTVKMWSIPVVAFNGASYLKAEDGGAYTETIQSGGPIDINGALSSEFLYNYYSSLYNGVPVVMVTGDQGLCESVKEIDPEIFTVPSNFGAGRSVTSPHPNVTIRQLEETAQKAVENRGRMKLDLPKKFETEVRFRHHHVARKGSYYPGARRVDDHTLAFDTNDYFAFLTFFMFVNTGE